MTDEHKRWIYEQIARQIEREDNLYQARIGSCIVVNLALLAAVATQINLPGLDWKNLIIIVGASAAGLIITRGIQSATADGETQLAYLRSLYGDLAKGRHVALVRPFLATAPNPKDNGQDREGNEPDGGDLSYPLSPFIRAFQLVWVVIPIFALLVFLPPKLREILTWLNQTST